MQYNYFSILVRYSPVIIVIYSLNVPKYLEIRTQLVQ